jgi:hypothetical protein
MWGSSAHARGDALEKAGEEDLRLQLKINYYPQVERKDKCRH